MSDSLTDSVTRSPIELSVGSKKGRRTKDGEESSDNGDDKKAIKKLELVTVLVRQAWL